MNFRAFPSAASVLLLAIAFAASVFGQTLSGDASVPRPVPEPPQGPARTSPSEAPPRDDFAETDANHDGRVSPDEYAASPRSAVDRVALGKRDGAAGPTGGFGFRNNEGNPQRSSSFKQRDANDDGFLSREELSRPLPPSDADVK
jgi:hypothetical protein